MVRISLSRSAIPLFDRMLHHSSVPPRIRNAAARSGGPGRPQGRREAALPWMGASTVACLRRLGTAACTVVMVLSFAIVQVDAAQVDNASTGHPPSARPAVSFANLIEEASRRFALPAHWIRAVMTVESAGDVRARSPKGAMGLMQIMPETWADLRAHHRFGHNPYDPRDNILAGAAYLHELYDRYGSPGFLAAYNAGPGRYEQYLAGRPLPAETRAYVATLAPLVGGGELAGWISVAVRHSKSWTEAPVFIRRPERTTAADQVSAARRSDHAPATGPMRDLSAILPQARSLFVVRSSAGDLQ
ncbi:lytic transglycosylase domain-containing protein [Tardiphaga sp. 42S5]|uniref:lytic transglycosylase domain-containing protein n=1 Tax=Tardiphaga sp. 42S5 TaxID=1404799 RepID=UPI002A5ABD3C|nr:lytic transglycosylase domain-containing protein [Tardiphaga sp. 42S5]WPO43193.1 lytic transglycosylase domain-containing protein [Tardiphaga sp. 42S5]